MSKKSIHEFMKQVEDNKELKERYIKIMEGCHAEAEKSMVSKLVMFGAEHGFDYTENELREAMSEYIDKMNEESKELSDSDMMKVAGGKMAPIDLAFSIVTLGIGCLMASTLMDHAQKGRCAAVWLKEDKK